jgi:hypothetical protein
MTIYKHPTLKEIREAEAWKLEYNKCLPIGRFVFRPLGYLLTWLAVRVGITSEAVSWLSGFVGLLGCLCLISGQEQLLALGIGLLLFFNLLDTVDGSIARTMKTENPYGRFLDSLMGWIDMGFWAFIGVMAYRHPPLLLWPNLLGKGVIVWLAIGGFACYFFILLGFVEGIFDQNVRDEWNSVSRKNNTSLRNNHNDENVEQASHRERPPFSVARVICHNLRVRETHYFLLILAYLGNAIDLLLGFFLFFYLLHTIFLVIVYSSRGRKIRMKYYA